MSQNGTPIDRIGSVQEYHGGLVDRAAAECLSVVHASASRPAAAVTSHAAAVVGSDGELLDAAVPFLAAGLADGDLVALTCPPETVELLSRELGTQAAAVESDPRLSLLGSRAPDALTACGRFLERATAEGSGRLRVLAEMAVGPAAADWREAQRFESVSNRFLGGAPLSALCLYDARRLPGQVMESAAATHPLLVHGCGTTMPNAAFQDPATYLASLPVPREPMEDGPPVLAVDDAPALADLRRRLGAQLASLVPDREQQEDLHLAVSEIAANAFRHGVRPVSARIWAGPGRIVCVISDRGTTYRDPFGGFLPAHGTDLSRGGMGLWLARKLWDHVDLIPGPGGLSVRLSTLLR